MFSQELNQEVNNQIKIYAPFVYKRYQTLSEITALRVRYGWKETLRNLVWCKIWKLYVEWSDHTFAELLALCVIGYDDMEIEYKKSYEKLQRYYKKLDPKKIKGTLKKNEKTFNDMVEMIYFECNIKRIVECVFGLICVLKKYGGF